MPIPLTPESVEAFAMSYLAKCEKSDDAVANEARYDWAWGAAMLLQEHCHYEHADRIFARCNALRKQINS